MPDKVHHSFIPVVQARFLEIEQDIAVNSLQIYFFLTTRRKSEQ